MKRILLFASIWLVTAISAHGTTIVVRLDGNRIYVAADSRQGNVGPGNGNFVDGLCKIRSFGNTIFANSGVTRHSSSPNGSSGWVLDWDAMQVAQAAYMSRGSETIQFANEWGKLIEARIEEYDHKYPDMASRDLSPKSPEDGICGGFFLSWEMGSPIIQDEWVGIQNDRFLIKQIAIPHDARERSSNSITDELIDGKTARAKAAAQEWKGRSSKYPAAELPWRRLQFLVEQTSIFDHTVSPTADILEISKAGKTTWLIRNGCK